MTGNVRIVLTHHAEARLAERGISVELIQEAIRAPDRRIPDPMDSRLERLFKAVPGRPGRVLRIVVSFSESDVCRVITAFLDRGSRT